MKKYLLVLLFILLPCLFFNCGYVNFNTSDNAQKRALVGLTYDRKCSNPAVPSPVSAGWPDESNTGPAGPLTLCRGNITTDHVGQTIENLEIHGVITVRHNDVTIRNCAIYGNSSEWVVINSYNEGGPHIYNLLIEYCLIDGNGITTGAVTGRNYTIRYCEILHAAQGIKVGNGTVVIDHNYIHDLWGHYLDSHNAAIGTNGESDVTDTMSITVTNNHIIADTTDCMGGASGAICLWGDFGVIRNWLIQNNRVAVGVDESYYIIAAGNPTKPYPHNTNIRILNNVLVYTERVGRNGGIMFFEDASGNVATGNTWEDTGDLVVPNPGGY